MNIRLAKLEELEKIESIYSDAREFMKENGNPRQWKNTYPPHNLILSDIEGGNLYTVFEDDEISGVFYFKSGDDPSYEKIYEGSWKNSLPYGVIHRIAVSKNARGKGIAKAAFDYAYSLCGNVKIDTHIDNIPMQKALEKCGFCRCGIIQLPDGEERIAYQKG